MNGSRASLLMFFTRKTEKCVSGHVYMMQYIFYLLTFANVIISNVNHSGGALAIIPEAEDPFKIVSAECRG
jgi:hypothetical protein